MNIYRYTAMVNGTNRSVTFAANPEDWGHDLDGEINLADAELIVDNEYDTYQDFYVGASDEDYDADREYPTLDALDEDRWVRVA